MSDDLEIGRSKIIVDEPECKSALKRSANNDEASLRDDVANRARENPLSQNRASKAKSDLQAGVSRVPLFFLR